MDNSLFYLDSSSDCRVTYGELARDVAAVDSVPKAVGFQNAYDLFVTLLAGARQGATLVLANEMGQAVGVEDELTKCRSEPRVTERENQKPGSDMQMASAPHPQPLSPEYWSEGSYDRLRSRIGLFTSGTTGKPKLVLHSIDSLTRGVRVNDKHQADVWGLAYHPAHIAGLQVLFQALANRNPLVRLFDLPVDQVHQAIESEGITRLSATPTFYNLLCNSSQIHPQVQSVTSGGELSHPSLRERMAITFPNARIHNIYASTEFGTLLISSGDQFHVPQKYDGRVIVIEGELAVHRSLLAASLQASWPDEFYRTGDCVEVLGSRPLSIRFISRQGDWINVGGYKVNPHEVEQALLALDEVQEVLVYGRDNSVTGSLVCCDIVLVGGVALTVKDIHTRLSAHMPAYMIPRIVRCVDAIGATHTGKKPRGS
ncbi:MAG: long-chain fatty acid--CoA ligase [Pirellulaceae bacterium]|nr:long-chain fatty acid--CoA ligase [Pirellulaceae bacterium]